MKINWKIVLIAVIVAISLVAFYIYKEYNRKPGNIANQKPAFSIDASEMIKEYNLNDSLANIKYLGKLVEVKGRIKQIDSTLNRFTVVLGDEDNLTSIRCHMDSTNNAQMTTVNHLSTKIKGICTGFIPDDMGLGSDIIIERAILSTSKK